MGFLGHQVSAAGVAVDPRKVAAFRDWPTPTFNVYLRRFIGLCKPATTTDVSWMDMPTLHPRSHVFAAHMLHGHEARLSKQVSTG